MASGIKLEDIERAMGKKASGGVVGPNLCSELIMGKGLSPWQEPSDTTRISGEVIKNYSTVINTYTAEDALRDLNKDYIKQAVATRTNTLETNKMKQNKKVEFDEIIWTIEIPGVPREDIEVFQVQDVVYVEVKDRPRISTLLSTDEKVVSSKLELGVLIITIDRPHKKVPIEVK